MIKPAQLPGWAARVAGATVGWVTVIGLILIVVAIVATVVLVIWATTLPKNS